MYDVPRNIIAVYVPGQFSQVVRLYSYYYPESNIPKDTSPSLSEFSLGIGFIFI